MALDSNLRILSWQILDQSNISGGGGDITISGADAREIIEDVIYDALTAGDNIVITYDDIPDPGIIRIGTTSSITVENLTASGIGTFGGSTQIATTGSGIDVIHFTEGVGGILCTDFTVSGTEHKVYNAGRWVSYMGPDYWDDSLSGGITWNAGSNKYDVSGTFNLYVTGDWPLAFRPTKIRLTVSGTPSGYLDLYVKDVHNQTVGIDEDFSGGVMDIAADENGDYGWQGADLDQINYHVGGGIAITDIEFFTTHYSLKSTWNTPLDVHANSITLGEQSVVLKEATYTGSTTSVIGLALTSPLMMYTDDRDGAMMWLNKGNNSNLIFMDVAALVNGGYPDDTFVGSNNIFFTHGAFQNPITSAQSNIFLDTSSTYLTTGQSNVFIGVGAAGRVTTGISNVFIGSNIATDIDNQGRADNMSYNIALGYRNFYWPSQNIGQYNIVMGYEAGYRMDGTGSVAIGYQAAKFGYQDSYIVAIGYGAASNSVGTDCVAIGRDAGRSAYGSGNIAIGYRSQYISNSGAYNVTIGYMAGYYLASGANQNVLIGHYAGAYSSTQSGDYNVGIGPYALYRFQSGTNNVAVGYYAGSESYNHENVFVGAEAGRLATAVSQCTYIGRLAGYQNDGNYNTTLGYRAGYNGDGSYNVFIGHNAAYGNTGSNQVCIGYYAGHQSGAGENVCIGYYAHYANSGDYNVAIGREAGYAGDGSSNVFMGHRAGRNSTSNSSVIIGLDAGYSATGADKVLIGYQAGFGSTGSYVVMVGRDAGTSSSTGTELTYIGHEAGRNNTGSYNTLLGRSAGYTGNGSSNTFVGHQAGYNNTGSNNVLIGRDAGYESGSTGYSVCIGYDAGRSNSGNYTVALGWDAGRTGSGNHNILLGYHAGYNISNAGESIYIGRQAGEIGTGSTNVFVGAYAGQNCTGFANTFVGYFAGTSGGSGNSNVKIGQAAGETATGNQNVFVGLSAGNAAGAAAESTAVGYAAGAAMTGEQNTAIGCQAGHDVTTSGNVFLGYYAGYYSAGPNKLYIANSDTTTPLIYGEFDTPMVRINGDLEIAGNLTVSGTVSGSVTRIDTQELQVSDNIITLNYDWPMIPPTESAGIEIERGTLTDSRILWDETADLWKAGLAGSEVEISLLGHTHAYLETANYKAGRTALALNDTSKTITFGGAYGDTDYTIGICLTNTTDSPPSIYGWVVSAKATTGFTVSFSGLIDSNNYVLEWTAIHD